MHYTHIYTYAHTHVHAHIHTYMHAYVPTYIHTYIGNRRHSHGTAQNKEPPDLQLWGGFG